MSSLKSRSLTALGWDLIGKYANQGTSFIISIFLARILEPRDFGLLAMANVFIALSQSFTDMGFGKALVQARNPTSTQYSTVFYINIAIGIVLCILFVGIAPWIAIYFKDPMVKPITQVMSLVFLISGLNVVQIAKFTRQLNFKRLTQANILASIGSGMLGVLLAFNGFGVWSLVAQSLTFAVLKSAVMWYFSDWRPSREFDLPSTRPLFVFGGKIFSAGFINTVFQKLDVLVIGKLFAARDLGFFFRAKSFNTLLIRFTSASLGNVLFPVFSQIQDDQPRVQRVLFTSLEIISLMVFGLMGYLFVNGEQLIVFLFSAKWLPSVIYFKFIILKGYAVPLNSLYMNLIKGMGKGTLFFKLELLKKLLYGVAVIVGIQFGIRGFIQGLVIVALFNTAINMGAVTKTMRISLFKQLAKIIPYALIATLLSWGLIQGLKWLELSHFWHIVVSGAVYFTLYLLILRITGLRGYHLLDEHLGGFVRSKLAGRR